MGAVTDAIQALALTAALASLAAITVVWVVLAVTDRRRTRAHRHEGSRPLRDVIARARHARRDGPLERHLRALLARRTAAIVGDQR
jgi:hypothetical protein